MKDQHFRRPAQADVPPSEAPVVNSQDDLTQKILSTFQPPQPAPGPEAPPLPTSQPQQDPAKKPSQRLTMVLAGIAAASLLLSAAVVGMSWAMLNREGYDDTELRTQIADLQQQLSTAATMPEDWYERQDDRMNDLMDRVRDQGNRLTQVEQAMPTGPDVDPPNDILTTWSLTGVPDLGADDLKVSFHCAAAETIREMVLSVYYEGRLEQTIPCEGDGTFFDAVFTAPLAGGRTYQLLLTYPDGSQALLELEGQGLAGLDAPLEPQLSATMKPVLFSNYTKERFWVGYDILHLTPSQYIPAENARGWRNLQIVYLYNGEYVSTTDLSQALPELDQTTQVLNFELPTQTFQMPDFQEGDIHQLYLEGLMMVDDNGGYPFSIPLNTWTVQNGELILAS